MSSDTWACIGSTSSFAILWCDRGARDAGLRIEYSEKPAEACSKTQKSQQLLGFDCSTRPLGFCTAVREAVCVERADILPTLMELLAFVFIIALACLLRR